MKSTLHVLAGSTETRAHLEVLRRNGWGRMWIPPRRPRPYPGERWGFDNGAYQCWIQNQPWNGARWQRDLERAYKICAPYLAVLPDIVSGGLRSLEFSLAWRERLPDDWPWYLAVQDGITVADVRPHLETLAGLFLGGTNDFKKTAPHWSDLAHRAGKKFHYARAGTLRKLTLARMCGADSMDSTFFLWKRERLRAFERWWKQGEAQLLLKYRGQGEED